MLNLFNELPVGFRFHFGDKPERIWFKINKTQAVLSSGSGKHHIIHPHVLVFRVSSKIRSNTYMKGVR